MKKTNSCYYQPIIAMIFVVMTSSCGLLFRTPPEGSALYYKITGVKIELLKEDSVSVNTIVLDTSRSLRGDNNLYFKLTFKREPNREAETGKYPGQVFSKCSKESIAKLNFIITKPNGEKELLTRKITQPDTTKKYKLRPFLSDERAGDFKDIEDLVTKLNACHKKVNPWSPFWSNGVIFICKENPVTENGKYLISAEIDFSDRRTVKSELKINGKVK